MMFTFVMTFNLICLIFLSSWTPLLSVLYIIFMALNICFLMSITSGTTWFSYIMFLIFLGGLMVLFTYMCSIAPNEFSKTKVLVKMGYAIIYTLVCVMVINWTWVNSMPSVTDKIQAMSHNVNLSILVISIIYLLLTLMVAVGVSSYKYGPIRAKKN